MFDMIPFRKNNDLLKRGDYFDSFVDNFFNNDFFNQVNFIGNNFKADLKETNNSYMVEADLPGISKEAINVSYNNNYLVISAKRQDDKEDKGENYIRRERRYGEFKRSFYIDNVDKDRITASFKNGVLKIELPKSQKEDINKRNIKIQ
ncbi:HSP20 family protein [Clostridium tetanomorphum]|uniref:Hsp20/alpha crystallin family protein n=1 Tax=Clostridium tetanomorphum TaxID=1553 RepID=A0A923J2Q1_CLOTT|nr:heat shock protein Hsp18 [Clostridium tetanomorphum]KAJ50043.1 heat shock protein [Clostridium tetanomorphum DSM 665]MBC2398980.1 Hsp20/alpha crystallin family protein [Clostridium tetanomorphum]MBP1866186.1 HSP20 family protein [Clostridium tetanomorphum]NRS86622.1 HSP20 family protein [Clostridium tetanomorphum]NRZ95397.1 HSP20 family protein [Clostridium tetanomorphum]